MVNQQGTHGCLRELALFAGAGGGILGGKLLGWRTVCAVEFDAYAATVLAQRQNDGCLEPFPIWSDITTFDGRPWRDIVDVVSGGFPCQDISRAGKGEGITGERSGLWSEMARVVREVGPEYVFVENSPMLTSRGLGVVLGDLAEMGFDARWGVLGACCVGAPHLRERIWIIANSKSFIKHKHVGKRGIQNGKTPEVQYSYIREKEIRCKTWFKLILDSGRVAPEKWRAEGYSTSSRPLLLRNDDGMADVLDRNGACGNGQVPAVVRLAWNVLSGKYLGI